MAMPVIRIFVANICCEYLKGIFHKHKLLPLSGQHSTVKP